MSETELAKQKVLAVYPKAKAMQSVSIPGRGMWYISTPAQGHIDGGRLSDYRLTEDAAWESAARHPYISKPAETAQEIEQQRRELAIRSNATFAAMHEPKPSPQTEAREIKKLLPCERSWLVTARMPNHGDLDELEEELKEKEAIEDFGYTCTVQRMESQPSSLAGTFEEWWAFGGGYDEVTKNWCRAAWDAAIKTKQSYPVIEPLEMQKLLHDLKPYISGAGWQKFGKQINAAIAQQFRKAQKERG